MSRITQRMLTQTTMANLQMSGNKKAKLQEQLSTGRSLNRPSDSPTGLVTAMQTRSSLARKETHLRNADNAKGWLDTADGALQGATDMLRRARDLVVQGSNTSFDDTGRKAIAQEIRSIREGLLEISNTKFGNRHLFAGNANGAAFDAATGAFLGDADTIERTIGDGQQIQINLTGSAVFGEDAESVFAILAGIADDLESNAPSFGNNLVPLDAARNRILNGLGEIGARQNRLDGIQDRGLNQLTTLKSLLNDTESIDLPETIMELQMQEVAYQAALGATARVLQPSLLDFLR